MNGRDRTKRGTGSSPVRITALEPTAAQDASQRMRHYLVLMGIRAVCFLGAVAVQHWTRWLLLLGAVVLPYVAVVIANAAGVRRRDPGTLLGTAALPAAGPTPDPPVAPTQEPRR